MRILRGVGGRLLLLRSTKDRGLANFWFSTQNIWFSRVGATPFYMREIEHFAENRALAGHIELVTSGIVTV